MSSDNYAIMDGDDDLIGVVCTRSRWSGWVNCVDESEIHKKSFRLWTGNAPGKSYKADITHNTGDVN